jgi:effector-binding domain-containing protein
MTATQLDSMEVTVPSALVAQLERSTSDPATIAATMGEAFETLYAAVQRNGLQTVGPPRAIYTTWSPDEVRFTVAVPIERAPPTPLDTPDVTVEALPECTALRFVHHGPYRELRSTYGRIEGWLRDRGGIKEPADWAKYAPMWEEYMNDPQTTPESELVTRIYLALR